MTRIISRSVALPGHRAVPEAIRILVADDHPMVREGLRRIVETRPGWRVVAEAATAHEVLRELRLQPVSVVVLDITLGEGSGFELLRSIRSDFPSVRVLMLSMHDEKQYAIRCLRAGASGYLQKESAAHEILRGIERVSSGHTYVSEEVAEQLAVEAATHRGSFPHEQLSTREFEVFSLIAGGRTVGEIATTLHLSPKTVSTYRARILEKTGFRNNAEIIRYAIRNGLA